MQPGGRGDDPGWGAAGQVLLAFLAPRAAVRRSRGNGLVALRAMFLGFYGSLLVIGVVSLAITPGERSVGPVSASAAVAVIGFVLILAPSVVEPGLRCTSPQDLAASYRTRFLLRIAFANAAALIGFVAVLLAASPSPYRAGLAAATIGYARHAPTTARLQREQDALTSRGCGLSLLSALQTPSSRP